jgi:thioredoxin-like negative regulator of GroEL
MAAAGTELDGGGTVTTPEDRGPDVACSFCGKGTPEVGHLFAGPGVWICDGCVRACAEILDRVEQRLPAVHLAESPPGTPDPVMAEIARAQQEALRGDRRGAAVAFGRIGQQLGADADPLHRVTLAHYTADVQDDAEEALRWDLRALAAADAVPRDHPRSAAIRGLYASLQVNVAAGYHELGRREEARAHLVLAQVAEEDLPADGYGSLVRAEIEALRARLDDPVQS